MKRYNIALIPSSPGKEVFTAFSRNNFTSISSGYLLDDDSMPHITLFQFEYNSSKITDITNALNHLNIEAYHPKFTGINLILLDGQYEEFHGQSAIELGVKSSQILTNIHRIISGEMQKLGLQALNPALDLYRPHLSLATIKNEYLFNSKLCIQLEEILFTEYEFNVQLGIADKFWQFNKLI